jgi:hypothetical protein
MVRQEPSQIGVTEYRVCQCHVVRFSYLSPGR